ncbi:peptidoglycan editing factor PgeF [Dietzia sp.]|uniref:peptidoglycan editing factor PgeF n=1 Tax=Dietzia sp. TaxID=1871616 RepID=UPI002FDB490B
MQGGEKSRVRRIVTTRRGGASGGKYSSFNLGDHVGDDPAAVRSNRRRLAEAMGLDDADIVWMEQVHGTRVVRVTSRPGGAVPRTDALVTDRPGLALAVLSADCVPVLAADEEAGVIGAAHAGRVGAEKGIVPAMIAAMESLGAQKERITVLLGPAASGEHYELPEEMAAATESVLPGSRCTTVDGTAGVDLRKGIARQLAGLGVEQVDSDPRSTIADPELFSYRREGTTGRLASVIVREA